MKYKIIIKQNDEILQECSAESVNKEKYIIHLNLLIEDISITKNIENVSFIENEIFFTSSLKEDDVLEKLKVLFAREVCYIRFISIVEIL